MHFAKGLSMAPVAEKGDIGSIDLRAGVRFRAEISQEVDVRLKPWAELTQSKSLHLAPPVVHEAIRLIDPKTKDSQSPSAITTGARAQYWERITKGDDSSLVKPALVAAMLAHEGLNRMSKLRESNSYNLPTVQTLIEIISNPLTGPDTKGLAVLLMAKNKFCGTNGVDALKALKASPDKSDFLNEALDAAAKILNNALKAA